MIPGGFVSLADYYEACHTRCRVPGFTFILKIGWFGAAIAAQKGL